MSSIRRLNSSASVPASAPAPAILKATRGTALQARHSHANAQTVPTNNSTGVQLGKDLAGDVRANIRGEAGAPRMNPSTAALLERYRVATRAAPP